MAARPPRRIGIPRFHWPRRTPPGAPPGALIPDPLAAPPEIQALAYGPDGYEEQHLADLAALPALLARWPVTWVNVDGLGDMGVLRQLGGLFDLHPLALEDVINLHQRAKVDDYGHVLFVVTQMAAWEEGLRTEQISLFLGSRFVLTFQYLPGDSFGPVRTRIRQGNGLIRQAGADYLAYTLLDAVLDGYFPVLETYGERLEGLEEDAVDHPDAAVRSQIHDTRHDLRTLRRAVWPQREALNQLVRDPSPLIGAGTRIYLRDAYDHAIQLIDLIETYRELGADLMDLYLSGVSNRMNEIMKVLTIIATIFIPLSFIASLYGMNFNPAASPLNMPELNWFWGYPWALGLMFLTASLLLAFFARRKWL